MTRRTPVPGNAVAAAVVLLGCGGSGSTATGSADASVPPSEASAADAADAEDEAVSTRDGTADGPRDSGTDAATDAMEGDVVLLPPTFTPPAGAVPQGSSVAISCRGAPPGRYQILYTTNGQMPTPSSPIYAGPVSITASVTILAVCTDRIDGLLDSHVGAASYTLIPSTIDGGTGNCVPSAANIYILTDANLLYAFDPKQKVFTQIGPVSCPGETPPASNVNSLAIDRRGNAYVNFTSGHLCKCPTTAPVDCQPTTFVPNQAGFANALGMAFASDAAGSDAETLYVADTAGPFAGRGLGTIDLTTMTLTRIGGFTGLWASGYGASLTGTGDGKLYGFFTFSPGFFAEINKTTGATPPPYFVPDKNGPTGGWAYAFWGGDFWFFRSYMGLGEVTLYVTAPAPKGGYYVAVPLVGYGFVAASASTCAPLNSGP